MSDLEDATNKGVARCEGESTIKQCLRCGAAVLGVTVSGPGATERTNRPCGCHAPVREVETEFMVFEIECPECGIEREIEDNARYVGELAEMHAEEYRHRVTVEEVER
jgi:peptide subunit release factor 1 (eRF1)